MAAFLLKLCTSNLRSVGLCIPVHIELYEVQATDNVNEIYVSQIKLIILLIFIYGFIAIFALCVNLFLANNCEAVSNNFSCFIIYQFAY